MSAKPTAKRVKSEWPKHLVVLLLLGIELLPFYMMLQISVKNNAEFLNHPWLPLPPAGWHWSNLVEGFQLIFPYIANTVFVAVLGTVCTLFLAILGAYFFARYKMPFSNFFWAFFLFLMLMPGVANIVPLFSLLKSMSLLNSLWTLVLLAVAGGQVFNIYVLRNFIEDIPKDLFEAAEMDGASHFKQIINVVIPMSGSIIGTLAILSFIGQWNDFLMPLLLMRDKELFTLGVGLIYLDGEYIKQWGKIMAAFLVASAPLLIMFLFTMKLFVRGLGGGALKG